MFLLFNRSSCFIQAAVATMPDIINGGGGGGGLGSTFPEQGQFQALRELSVLSCPTACLNEIWPYHLLNFRSLWGLNETIRVDFQILSETNSLTKLMTALAAHFLSVLPAGGELEWAGRSHPQELRVLWEHHGSSRFGSEHSPNPGFTPDPRRPKQTL